MAGDGLWRAGRHAWERLSGWQGGKPDGGHPDAGAGALAALDDIGKLRRLLDRAELTAVRSARSHGKSWAEIATRLGVTRQSAWERWRDVDETSEAAETSGAEPVGDDVGSRAVEHALKGAAEELTVRVGPPARDSRRRASVRVPSVLGMSWAEANGALRAAGLLAVGWNANGLPLDDAAPSGVVTDQTPESGAKVPRGASIRLWLYYDGGSAGVREPRRPHPNPSVGRAS